MVPRLYCVLEVTDREWIALILLRSVLVAVVLFKEHRTCHYYWIKLLSEVKLIRSLWLLGLDSQAFFRFLGSVRILSLLRSLGFQNFGLLWSRRLLSLFRSLDSLRFGLWSRRLLSLFRSCWFLKLSLWSLRSLNLGFHWSCWLLCLLGSLGSLRFGLWSRRLLSLFRSCWFLRLVLFGSLWLFNFLRSLRP